MKIFIDANIYLDFYRSNNDAIKVFDELIKNSASVILTDQIIDEFFRNREVVLRMLKNKFRAETEVESFSSSFLQSIKEFGELANIKSDYNKKRKEIEVILNSIIEDPNKDPIVYHFDKLINSGGITILKTTKEILDLAHQRKLKGNPPVSDKYSIGDEINWELLINNVKEDIAVVARDSTFKDNFNFLKRNYQNSTNHTIVELTERITKALEVLGKAPAQELKQIEEEQVKELKSYNHTWKVVSVQGNIANVTNGRLHGYTVIDSGIADPSFRCGHCWSYGPWNGSRCLTCGQMSDD